MASNSLAKSSSIETVTLCMDAFLFLNPVTDGASSLSPLSLAVHKQRCLDPLRAATVAAVVLAGNTLLRPLVNWINRRPLDARTTEALYQVHIVCAPSDVADMRELLSTELEKANYPIQAIDMLAETEDWVELAASLVPTTAAADELDAVVVALEAAAGVESATWTVSTMS